MKTRFGFVSNSSSVSFTLVGVTKDVLVKKYGMTLQDYVDPDEHSLNDYGDETAFGLIMTGEIEHQDVGKIKDDETPKMFEERARAFLSKKFGTEIKEKDITRFHVSYYNG